MDELTVLVVDDESDIRTALGRILSKEGYRLHFAGSGAEALDIVQQNRIDVVVTDHRMPGMTGLDLIRTLNRTHPDIVRIILTGYADLETVRTAINEAEIYRFLTKPWDDDDLRLTLRAAMARCLLERENRRLLESLRAHEMKLAELERLHPGITRLERDESGAIVISDEE